MRLSFTVFAVSLAMVGNAKAQSVLAFENITAQLGGPRQGENGQRFFNIEGSSHGDFASFGAARFDISEIRSQFDANFGVGFWTLETAQLQLTQANASFTADGEVEVWFIKDDEVDVSQFGFLSYPFDADDLEATAIMKYEFEQIADGEVETYNLFNLFDQNSDGGQLLQDDIMNDDIVTLALVEADEVVAATYAGFAHESFEGPTLLLSAIQNEQQAPTPLQAGDADEDLDFDQLDLVRVQVANKYLTGQTATWGEGDWNGAPGGRPGEPPAGDGQFNQFDIIAAQTAAVYLTGPYAAVRAGGQSNDGQASVGYDPSTGELFVDAPSGAELTSINIDSAGSILTAQAAQNLGGSFDNDADNNIFKATFGGSFGSLSFGNVAQGGLSHDFILNDLTVVGSLAGGGPLGDVDLIYVPEPASVLLFALGLTTILAFAEGLRFQRVGMKRKRRITLGRFPSPPFKSFGHSRAESS